MRMVKFHHRASTGAAPSPEAQLAAVMGTTSYILHADQLGADASTVSSWGPFSGVGSPVVDADGYLGALKTLNFNGTSQSLLHPTTGLITSGGSYTMAMAATMPDVTTTGTRVWYSFNTAASGAEQHGVESAYVSGNMNTYIRNNGNTAMNFFIAQHDPVIMIAHRTATHTRVKLYQSGNTGTYYNLSQSLTIGATPAHELCKRAGQAFGYSNMRLRFAALSVNQGALDEAGMDALASFLQSGPYNCPLS